MAIAPATSMKLRSAIGLMVLLLLAGWIIHLVSLAIVQANIDGRYDSANGSPAGVNAFVNQVSGRTINNVYSMDWWFWSFFTFVNLLLLAVLARDSQSGAIVKYRIPASIYAAIAAIFCTIRINDFTFNTAQLSSAGKALLAAYYIQAVPYYLTPFLNGIAFLDTVASTAPTGPDVGYAETSGVPRGGYTTGYTETTAATRV